MTSVLRVASTTSSVMTLSSLIRRIRSIWGARRYGLKMYGKAVHHFSETYVATLAKRSEAYRDVLRYRVVRVCRIFPKIVSEGKH